MFRPLSFRITIKLMELYGEVEISLSNLEIEKYTKNITIKIGI
jgi:hypothetical protein